jgi:hypothetical protein
LPDVFTEAKAEAKVLNGRGKTSAPASRKPAKPTKSAKSRR